MSCQGRQSWEAYCCPVCYLRAASGAETAKACAVDPTRAAIWPGRAPPAAEAHTRSSRRRHRARWRPTARRVEAALPQANRLLRPSEDPRIPTGARLITRTAVRPVRASCLLVVRRLARWRTRCPSRNLPRPKRLTSRRRESRRRPEISRAGRNTSDVEARSLPGWSLELWWHGRGHRRLGVRKDWEAPVTPGGS